jgi:hypothetical protein
VRGDALPIDYVGTIWLVGAWDSETLDAGFDLKSLVTNPNSIFAGFNELTFRFC